MPGLSEGLAAAAGHLRHGAGRHRRLRAAGERRRPGQRSDGQEQARGRGKPTLGNGACEQVSAFGNTLMRCYRQHTHKNPRCFRNQSGEAGCPR